MKVVTAKEMARIEKLAYERGAHEKAFMEAAGLGIAKAIQRLVADLHLYPKITLLCGSGNNAGDAYTAGALLGTGGYEISAIALAPHEKSSPLCQAQSKEYIHKGRKIHYVERSDEIHFEEGSLIIDGIFGTGFKGEVEGLYYSAIEQANATGLPILSIDIPSGVDGTTGNIGNVAIQAHTTVFLGLPKVGCFVGEAWRYVGNVRVHDFGLDPYVVSQATSTFELLEEGTIKKMLPKIDRCRHKYQAGYVVGIGGSVGFSGAPILSSYAALRAGAGIVRLFHPEEMEMAQLPLEVIHQGYQSAGEILESLQKVSAIFVGPGMGTSAKAAQTLKEILSRVNKPCVIDADALTLIAEHNLPLPKKAILTPHQGEMLRLLKQEALPKEKLIEFAQQYSDKHEVIIVLKGAPTFLFHPKKIPHICSRGDPGMATAGSGDVLTGVLAAVLAQLQDPWQAAQLGTYLHGLAGEIAAKQQTSYGMVASDLTAALPLAFRKLMYHETNF